MKVICGFLLLFFVVCWAAAPARAELDQLCLKNCVTEGNSSVACLQKCTYGDPPAAPVRSMSALPKKPRTSHNVLKTPVPIGDKILPSKQPAPKAPEKDYACFNECLHNGTAYGLCERNCAKRP